MVIRWLVRRLVGVHALLVLLGSLSCSAPVYAQLRGEVETELRTVAKAFESDGNSATRRVYAEVLFRLGDLWQAEEIIAPLATPSSSNTEDLFLGARVALMLSDYERAQALYKRLLEVAPDGSAEWQGAFDGLVLVYYQSNQYEHAQSLLDRMPEETERDSPLLIFMSRFEGEPYQIEWTGSDEVAHLPIVNEFERPGALPLVRLQINGHEVELILDTGGDRLMIDEGVAEEIGVDHLTNRRSRYAYTGGEFVDEPLGVVESVSMGEVTLRNVPVVVAKWKAMGPTSDGVITTQILKQFLSTVDYSNRRITFRERGKVGLRQFMESAEEREAHTVPFFMAATHLMFAKGSINGHESMNMFVDSGLAASMPLVILDETARFLDLPKNEIQGTEYYWSPIESHGIGTLVRGQTQALGNVLVEENSYWRQGFLFDALISHQYLRHLGSWTIDFDNMVYYFPR